MIDAVYHGGGGGGGGGVILSLMSSTCIWANVKKPVIKSTIYHILSGKEILLLSFYLASLL